MEAVLKFFLGLAFFLFGMNAMSGGLEKLAGGKMEKTLKKMTSKPVKGMALGAGITAVIQSSSATTVMLVGLVNSGIMTLAQSIGVIMGANIGTTVTAWILTLTGLDGDQWWMLMLKPANFSPILAIIGVAMIMMCKKAKNRDIGTILVSFAVLMYGMEFMGDAVDAVPEEYFAKAMTIFNNPLLGVLVGAVITAIIQSSSASVGILQTVAMAEGSTMTFGMAIPIILGQNIGTCITSLISSIGANKNAKRVVVVHFAFNLIGTALFMVVYYIARGFLTDFMSGSVDEIGIATVHTVFNVVTTCALLPFAKLLEKLAKKVVRDKVVEHPVGYLDERLLKTPSVAIVESKRMTVKMAELARDTLIASVAQLEHYDAEKAAKIEEEEGLVDTYEDTLGSFLVKLSAMDLSDHDGAEISKLLLSIADFERLSDHAVMILRAAQEMNEKGLSFSEEARRELAPIIAAITKIVGITVDAFDRSDLELAKTVEPLEEVIDGLIADEKARHIERLQKGACTIELGFILNDLLTGCERVSDHCSNIAVCLIQTKRDAFATHSYLNKVKHSGKQSFVEAYEAYAKEFALPQE